LIIFAEFANEKEASFHWELIRTVCQKSATWVALLARFQDFLRGICVAQVSFGLVRNKVTGEYGHA